MRHYSVYSFCNESSEGKFDKNLSALVLVFLIKLNLTKSAKGSGMS